MRNKKFLVGMLTSMMAMSMMVMPAMASVTEYGEQIEDTQNAIIPDGFALSYDEGNWFKPYNSAYNNVKCPVVAYYNTEINSDTDSVVKGDFVVTNDSGFGEVTGYYEYYTFKNLGEVSGEREAMKAVNSSIQKWGKTVDFYALNRDYYWAIYEEFADGTFAISKLNPENPVWENKNNTPKESCYMVWIAKEGIAKWEDYDWENGSFAIDVPTFENHIYTIEDNREYKVRPPKEVMPTDTVIGLLKPYFSYTFDDEYKLTVNFKGLNEDVWQTVRETDTQLAANLGHLGIKLVTADGDVMAEMWAIDPGTGEGQQESAFFYYNSADYVTTVNADGTGTYTCTKDKDIYGEIAEDGSFSNMSWKYEHLLFNDFSRAELDVVICTADVEFSIGKIQNKDNYEMGTITEITTPSITKYENTCAGVKLTYTKIDGAKTYNIYRKIPGGSWSKIATTSKGTVTYVDTTAVSGQKYYYTVKACNGSNMSSYVTGSEQLYLTGTTVTKTNICDGVQVKWSKVTGATGYYVYRREGTSGSWTKIKTITSNATVSYTDTTAVSGKTYYYTVKPYSGNFIGGWKTGTAIKFLAPATSTKSVTSTGVKISWNKVSAATGYYVLRREGTSGSWTKIKTITSNATVSYTDTTAVSGKTYYYTVKAYNGSTLSGWKTGSATKYLAAPTPSVSATTGKVTVKWSKTTGASGYYVYRKTAGGSWSKIATVKSGSTVTYTDTTAKKGTTYYYCVKAYSGSTTSSYKSSSKVVAK